MTDTERLTWCVNNRVEFQGESHRMDWPRDVSDWFLAWDRCGMEVRKFIGHGTWRDAIDQAMAAHVRPVIDV